MISKPVIARKRSFAFSLVEMLMALLVASLLLAALAPVMTRKMGDTVNINSNMMPSGGTKKTLEIEYGSADCNQIKTDLDGSQYCEGEYTVKGGYNGYIQVTVIGAGGGGGTAPTAGYTEYTTEGSSNSFVVPAMTGNIETTLVSGGGGGSAGNSKTVLKKFTNVGESTFTIPDALKNKNAIVDICGGGGQGGATATNACWSSTWNVYYQGTGGGGSGGYYQNKVVKFENADSTEVYVGAGGNKQYGNIYDKCFYTPQSGMPHNVPMNVGGNGTSGEGGGGGTGGKTGEQYCSGRSGGNGGTLLGGGSGAGVGHCGNTGTGGGGGGASRLGKSGDSHYLYVGGGGGGGGEGLYMVSAGGTLVARNSGGAGGGGGGTGIGGGGGNSYDSDHGCYAYGGGGGKPGGNDGGRSGCNNSNPATSGGGGASPLSKYPNNCAGGHGWGYNGTYSTRKGADSSNPRPKGLDGIIAINYLDYSTGGAGGGCGKAIETSKIKVTPNNTLNVNIGKGGNGGKGAYINSSGTIVAATNPSTGGTTGIFKNSTALIQTGTSMTNSEAGDSPNGLSGGKGGEVSTVFTSCTIGNGGTEISKAGANASGYGCGGGGGYALSDGGKGSGGYARISWNTFWDTNSKVYKTSATGAGGGGASGNIFTYNIPVISNQIIKYRIGKGGRGAYVSSNILYEAVKGGDTTFGDVTAGGGGGGKSTSINTTGGTLINGTGGMVSDICKYKTDNYISNASKCTKGLKGNDANASSGGSGANFTGYSAKLIDETGKEFTKDITGTGGKGGLQGDNSSGKNAVSEGYAAGGGGAAIRNLGQVNSSSQTNITKNENTGGDGSNGKIILMWYE